MWISGKCTLKVEKGCRSVTITDLQKVESTGLPKGVDVNPELADPETTSRYEAQRVWHEGGEIELGTMRVLNGGGVYEIPPAIDLACKAGTHEAIWQKVCQKFDSEPTEAYPVVFRDWGAPGTFGVLDGGGAGRGEEAYQSSSEFLVKKCLGENLGEIGLLVHEQSGIEGRVRYRLPKLPKDLANLEGWLEQEIVEEWGKSHGSVPPAIATADVTLASLPDRMLIEGMEVRNIALAFEWQSASIECLTLSRLSLDMPQGSRLRFVDLESRGGKGLHRRIGVILRAEDQLAVIFYDGNGQFDPDCPAIPVTNDTVRWCGNDKFAAVIEMIRSSQ